MGEGAKKKCLADAAAARKAKKAAEKATQPVESPASDDPTGTSSDIKQPTRSNAKNSKKIGASGRIPSSSSTRRSTRSISTSGLSGEKHTSAGCNNESTATRPQRSASAEARALLCQLQFTETEGTDFEEDDEDLDDGGADMIIELDDGDGAVSGDDEHYGDESDVEILDNDQDLTDLVAPPTRKGLPKASAVSRSVQAQKKPKLKSVDEEESSGSSTEPGESVCWICCTRYRIILTETFEMKLEINDKAKGARKNITLPSSTSWASLRDKVAQVLNIHPESLQLQYRFSNEKNNLLPFDLHSHDEYGDMRDQLRPFVVPKILANGKLSKSIRKPVTVQLFNRGMEGGSAGGEKGVKVSI